MKRLVIFALLLGTLPAWAEIRPLTVYVPGTVWTDSIRWKSSGAIPGTSGVRVDTIRGQLNDTSMTSYFVGGAQWAAVSVVMSWMCQNVITTEVASNMRLVVQQSPTPDGPWFNVGNPYTNIIRDASIKNDTATMLLTMKMPGSTETARLNWDLLNSRGDFRPLQPRFQARAGSAGFVRFIIDPTLGIKDTLMVKGIISRVF